MLLVCAVLALPKLVGEPFAGLPLLGDRVREPVRLPGRGAGEPSGGGYGVGGRGGGAVSFMDGEAQGAATDTGVPGQTVKAQPGEIPDVSGRDVVEAARAL